MPKGYIDFDTFKAQHPHKERIPTCPRCKQPMTNITRNIYGKVMCADCLAADEQKREGFRKRKEEADAKLTQELEDAEAIRA
jgi:uncharacterized Zn finger protein (UPF0148 family)